MSTRPDPRLLHYLKQQARDLKQSLHSGENWRVHGAAERIRFAVRAMRKLTDEEIVRTAHQNEYLAAAAVMVGHPNWRSFTRGIATDPVRANAAVAPIVTLETEAHGPTHTAGERFIRAFSDCFGAERDEMDAPWIYEGTRLVEVEDETVHQSYLFRNSEHPSQTLDLVELDVLYDPNRDDSEMEISDLASRLGCDAEEVEELFEWVSTGEGEMPTSRNSSPAVRQRSKPIFLTNACLESTGHVGDGTFAQVGLQGARFDGAFYPLTLPETAYLEERSVAGGYELLCGYSVLYQNQKWLAPTLELPFLTKESETEGSKLPGHNERLGEMQNLLRGLSPLLREVGGFGDLEKDAGPGDRHILTLFLPIGRVRERFPDPADYRNWLDTIFRRAAPLQS